MPKYTKQSWPSVMEGDWILSLDDMERHGGFVDILVGMGYPAPFLFPPCLLQWQKKALFLSLSLYVFI